MPTSALFWRSIGQQRGIAGQRQPDGTVRIWENLYESAARLLEIFLSASLVSNGTPIALIAHTLLIHLWKVFLLASLILHNPLAKGARKGGGLMQTPLNALLPHTVSRPDVTLCEAALAYAHAGLPVLPLRGKVPLVSHGLDDASVDPAAIKRWWRRWPLANIGIATGSVSGWVVLDVDPRHGGLESFRHLQQTLQHHAADLHCLPVCLLATRLQRSGGAGLHVMYGWREGLDLGNTADFAGYPGLDVRGKRGYIIVTPSRHTSGGVYSWLNPGPLQPFPEMLVDLLHTRTRILATPRFPQVSQPMHQYIISRRRDPAAILTRVLEEVSIGNRHHKALTLSFQLLKDAALSPAQAEAWIRDYARRVPQGEGEEHYPEEDALACLRWVARHTR